MFQVKTFPGTKMRMGGLDRSEHTGMGSVSWVEEGGHTNLHLLLLPEYIFVILTNIFNILDTHIYKQKIQVVLD